MASLTITLDDVTLKRARVRALTEGSSVDEVLRRFVESYAGVDAERAAALNDLIDLSRRSRSRRGSARQWSRDELRNRK